jgi:hypothetical protein
MTDCTHAMGWPEALVTLGTFALIAWGMWLVFRFFRGD